MKLRQRMKKLSLCIMTAFAVLLSVTFSPSIAMADDKGWIPFFTGNTDSIDMDMTFYLQDDLAPSRLQYVFVQDMSALIQVNLGELYRITMNVDGVVHSFMMDDSLYEEIPSSADSFGYVLANAPIDPEVTDFFVSLVVYQESGLVVGDTLVFVMPDFGLYGISEASTVTLSIETYTSVPSGVSAFENGQFINSSLAGFEIDGTGFLAYPYGEYAPVPDLRESPTGKYLITYNNVEYIVTPSVEEHWTGAIQTTFFDDSGNAIAMINDAEHADSGTITSMLLVYLEPVEGALFSMTVYEEPPAANLPTFLGAATSTIDWLISMFSSILLFMLKNPICFIGLIASLIVVVVKVLQGTTGNK